MSRNDAAMDDIMASLANPPAVEPEVEAPLATAVPPPAGGDGTTLEQLVRTMLEPMLKQWLDAHLPEIVDRAAQAEIARLTRRV